MNLKFKKLFLKTILFILSLSLSWYLFKSPFLKDFVEAVLPFRLFSEFIAGMLYVSFLTSPASLAMIAVLAKGNNPIVIALIAGMGAAFSDLLMVRFLRKFSKDTDFMARQLQLKKLNVFFIKWKIDFLIPLAGAFIIASPLPDEPGLLMLGASKLKYRELAILTYVLNTAGILLVTLPFNLLS